MPNQIGVPAGTPKELLDRPGAKVNNPKHQSRKFEDQNTFFHRRTLCYELAFDRWASEEAHDQML